jgi:integrase
MRKIKAALSPLFNTAIEDEVVPINIISGVRIPSQPKDPAPTGEDEDEDRGKALTRGELARFLAAVEEQPAKAKRRKSEAEQVGGFDWSVFFGFLAVTGLRIGEAVGLRWEHLDLGGKGGTVKVREQVYEGKRKRYLKSEAGKREIPLTPEWTKRLLEHRRDHYRGPKTPVFASVTGTELRPSNVYRRYLAPAAIDAGLFVEVEDDEGKTRKKTAIAFHAFRHTCASLLFAEGRNVKQVQEWLGHTDPAFTLKVYIHLLDDGLGEGINLPAVDPDDPSGVPHLDPGLDPSERSAA